MFIYAENDTGSDKRIKKTIIIQNTPTIPKSIPINPNISENCAYYISKFYNLYFVYFVYFLYVFVYFVYIPSTDGTGYGTDGGKEDDDGDDGTRRDGKTGQRTDDEDVKSYRSRQAGLDSQPMHLEYILVGMLHLHYIYIHR